jgi:predicted dehydrogenase
MSYPVRFVIVGSGGSTAQWCRGVLPKVIATNKAVPVAVADENPETLRQAQESLDLSAQQCFTNAAQAFDARRADFALILAPSQHHEQLVDLALRHDLHVLIDAPLADTMPSACRVYKQVRDSDKKLAVLMTHRYDQDKQTLLRLVEAREYGTLNYVSARSLHNCRGRGTWGRLRYDMPNPILVENAVHHFDLFRAISQSEPRIVHAVSWNPPWGDFRGDSTAVAVVEMENGVHCVYEGAAANAVTLNGWGKEYLRAECINGTLELNRRELRLMRGESFEEPRIAQLPLLDQPLWANAWLVDMFCDYINDAVKAPNRLKEVFPSMALTFAAAESARTGRAVDVQAYLKEQFKAA